MKPSVRPRAAGREAARIAGSERDTVRGLVIDRRASRTVLAVFVGVQLGMIMSTLDATIVATALPTIGRDLGHSGDRSWVITAYLLAQVATMPLYGKVGDLYGRKPIYLFSLGLFTVGSVLCGAAGSLEQLVAFRFVQGLGSGGLGVLAMAIVADIVPPRQLGRWLGYQGALFARSRASSAR